MKLLARIEDSFAISGRCVVVFTYESGDHRLRTGDSIQIRTPNGQIRDTQVAGIPHVKKSLLQVSSIPKESIELPSEITKADVPVGAEIWYPQSASGG